MGIRDLLRLPRKHRRARSNVQSEVNTSQGRRVDLGTLPRSEPNLGIGSSILLEPVLSASENRESNGTWTTALRVIYLTILSRDAGNFASDPTQPIAGTAQTEHSEPPEHTVKPGTADENKQDWKSTAYAATKLAINIVKESSDTFPPLKSVVGGLSAILDHCDVRSIPRTIPYNPHDYPSKQWLVVKY